MSLFLQILKDDATREQYDYAIAHPEEVCCLRSSCLIFKLARKESCLRVVIYQGNHL
jgi:hypothetical protein